MRTLHQPYGEGVSLNTTANERRGSPRRRARADLSLTTDSGRVLSCRLVDVSDTGAKLASADGFGGLAKGDRVTASLTHDRVPDPPRREGVVVWLDGACENRSTKTDAETCDAVAGIEFVDGGGVALEPVDIDQVKIDLALPMRLQAQHASRWQVLPFARDERHLLVAAASFPPQPRVLTTLQRLYGLAPEIHLADPERLALAIDRIYARIPGSQKQSEDRTAAIDRGTAMQAEPLSGSDDDAVALCDRLLYAAAVQNASDIHIDSYESEVRVRFRVDGQLEDIHRVTPEQGGALISRVKVLAGMNIAERRAPQDGRMQHEQGKLKIDIRVASLPVKQGERLTLRLLARETERLTLPALGMNERQLGLFHEAIHKPHGLVLITGPTGSGKSTTLYAAIRQQIHETVLNVLTIEDPVEYQIDGITQVEVDQKEKVTFAKALRSALRHDPDVIMVGEIRDAETADIAVKAALTGHLVFSTLHTNDAPGAITRLRDMGVPLFLVAATLRLVMAQRLVRRLCPRCSMPSTCPLPEAQALHRPDLEGVTVHRAVGCMYCAERGYNGRLALFEALPCNSALAELIASGSEEHHYVQFMRENGFPRLTDDAADKLADGRTSMEEVLRHVISTG